MKIAVVTPYYKESEATLRRCLDSVRAQTHGDVVHYMVADGHPRADVLADYPAVKHIVLPQAHADYGCTPRSVGAMCALNEGADMACFLDADNLLTPDHAASLVDTCRAAEAKGERPEAVFAHRHVFLPGHPELRLSDPEDMARRHVDTSCIALTRAGAIAWTLWGMIPRAVAPICDRIMFDLIRMHGLRMHWTGRHTVLYESNWSSHYRLAGLPVPSEGLHDHTVQGLSYQAAADELYARLRMRVVQRPPARPSQAMGGMPLPKGATFGRPD